MQLADRVKNLGVETAFVIAAQAAAHAAAGNRVYPFHLSLIHISEPTRPRLVSRMASSA